MAATFTVGFSALLLLLTSSGQLPNGKPNEAISKGPNNMMHDDIIDEEHLPRLPNCMQTNISRSSPDPLNDEAWTERTNNPKLNVCWPLSPQLLNCPLRRLDVANYTIVNHTLVDNEAGLTATLGDYYVATGSTHEAAAAAYTCRESIVNERNLPRCHYLMAFKGDYEIGADGSVHVFSADVTVRRPSLYTTYDHLTGTLNLCVPLNTEIFTCTLFILLVPDFEILNDKRLYNSLQQAIFDYDDYMPYDRKGEQGYAICAHGIEKKSLSAVHVFTTFHILSSICLAITVIVQLTVFKPTCYSKSILCYVISMMTFYVDMTIRKLVEPKAIDRTFCYVLFAVNYYFNMSAFMWLNMLSLDVWLFFARGTTGSSSPIAKNRSHRFTCYSAIAWGIPAAFLTAALLIDGMTNLQSATRLYPRIESSCWFNDRPSNWAFYYGPLSVIMACSLAYFVLTVVTLRRSSQGTELANRNRTRKLFHVCIKLLVVMGLCWTVEVIFWLIKDNDYWYLAEAVTSPQGVAVFAVCICKWRTYGLLRAKLCNRDDNETGQSIAPSHSVTNRSSFDTSKA